MNYELVEKFLSTLFHSWASDTPQEAVWAANDFLMIIERMHNYKFSRTFSEYEYDAEPGNNYDLVLEEIKRVLTKRH